MMQEQFSGQTKTGCLNQAMTMKARRKEAAGWSPSREIHDLLADRMRSTALNNWSFTQGERQRLLFVDWAELGRPKLRWSWLIAHKKRSLEFNFLDPVYQL